MSPTNASPSLGSARLLGVLGDTHGDLEHLLIVSETMWKRGVSVLLVLGDFGFIWPGKNWMRNLDRVSDQLGSRGQRLYFVDGNHENFRDLYDFNLTEDGLRPVRPNIAHIPRGYRTQLQSGVSFAALGGANSIDRKHRRENHTWWPGESISDADLKALGHEKVDLLVGHDAPLYLPGLDTMLARTPSLWREDMLDYAEAGRQQFHRGFLQVRPRLYLGGHYHLNIDETVLYGDGEDTFETRVMILSNGGSNNLSQGILNVHTKDVNLFQRDDSTVNELTGREDGQWRVETSQSSHILDLKKGTVTRHRGDEAPSSINDGMQRLARIEACRVGEPGAWTMRGGGYLDPVEYWQRTTDVQSIERLGSHEQ